MTSPGHPFYLRSEGQMSRTARVCTLLSANPDISCTLHIPVFVYNRFSLLPQILQFNVKKFTKVTVYKSLSESQYFEQYRNSKC